MNSAEWIALAGFILSLGANFVMGLRGLAKIEAAKARELNMIELAFERKVTQMEVGLRGKINDVEFYVRDTYVQYDIFNRMIEMAAASNENQFRALTESFNRLSDKLDSIQADLRRQP